MIAADGVVPLSSPPPPPPPPAPPPGSPTRRRTAGELAAAVARCRGCRNWPPSEPAAGSPKLPRPGAAAGGRRGRRDRTAARRRAGPAVGIAPACGVRDGRQRVRGRRGERDDQRAAGDGSRDRAQRRRRARRRATPRPTMPPTSTSVRSAGSQSGVRPSNAYDHHTVAANATTSAARARRMPRPFHRPRRADADERADRGRERDRVVLVDDPLAEAERRRR